MYLVIGANGFLGSYIIKNILEKTQDNILATARNITEISKDYSSEKRVVWESLDVTDDKAVDKVIAGLCGKEINVVYLAAYHKPDEVEKNPKLAWDINIIALSKILNKLDNVRCFFYASTDSVYGNSIDGHRFVEEDVLKPENKYGMQKKTAEALVNGYGYNVVRYPFLIGKSILKHKKHFYDFIVEDIKAGKEFTMFKDSFRSSLDFNTAAGILVELIKRYEDSFPKILNIAGDDDLSKYDVGIMVARKELCDERLIVPISINAGEDIFIAPRAASTLIDNKRVKEVLNLEQIKLKL